MQLSEMLHALDERPGMWLFDERYATFVAFVEGFVAGAGNYDLRDFSKWAAAEVLGRESSFYWSTVIAVGQNELVASEGPSVLSPDQSKEAIKSATSLLLRYFQLSP